MDTKNFCQPSTVNRELLKPSARTQIIAMNKFFFAISIAAIICASFIKPNEPSFTVSTPSIVDSLEGSYPFMTSDAGGNTVLSWVRKTSDSTGIFVYANSIGGKTFGKPVIIPSSDNIHAHGENIPKVVFKPSGEIIAIWGASNPNANNAYSGLVFYSQSFDGGKTWSERKNLVTDSKGYDQRYFDVDLMPNGEAAIIWLDNRKESKKDGSAIYFATTSGNKGFQGEVKIAESCCQCCRTDLFIDKSSNIHILYRAIINDSIRDMVHAVSGDGGQTFSKPKQISDDNWVLKGCPHSGPAMTANEEGVHFAWYTGGQQSGVFYTNTNDNGNRFEPKDSVSSKARHPQIVAGSDRSVIIAWDEPIRNGVVVTSKIGIEKRIDGKAVLHAFISPEKLKATYPVISFTDNNLLVAYSINQNGTTRIAFQHMQFAN